MVKVNLCGVGLEGFVNVDISLKADKVRNLNYQRIPFKNNSVDALICMSAINYFTKKRAQFLINEVYRILKPEDGVCRFGVQDLGLICRKYLDGEFDCDRLNRWFNSPSTDGYKSNLQRNKYVYDYATFEELFINAGFPNILQSRYKDKCSSLSENDNREDQMFFLEAWK
jgi:predicted SAM-dependent methyltransferase